MLDRQSSCVGNLIERILRHVGEHGGAWILDDGRSSVGVHDHESGSAVVEESSEDDADDAAATGEGSGAEERIDSGAVEILARAGQSAQHITRDDHVQIGRGDIDFSVLDGRPVLWMEDGKGSGATEDFGEETSGACRRVQNDEDRRVKIRRQCAHQLLQGLNTAGRCSDDNQVPMCHE